ncbi:hypothetical protein IAU59_006782 [Kwoniella sp. CBS 9459]
MDSLDQQPQAAQSGTSISRGGCSPHVCFLVFYGLVQLAGAVISFVLTLMIPQKNIGLTQYAYLLLPEFPFIANLISLIVSSVSIVGITATIYYEWKGSNAWVSRVKNELQSMVFHLAIEIAVNVIGTVANSHGGQTHQPATHSVLDDLGQPAGGATADSKNVSLIKYQTLTQQLDTAGLCIGWTCTILGLIVLGHFYYRAKQYQREAGATDLNRSLAILREQSIAATHPLDAEEGRVVAVIESHALTDVGGNVETRSGGDENVHTVGIVDNHPRRMFGRTPQAGQLDF